LECLQPNIEGPCPLLRIINNETFCDASQELEEVTLLGENGKKSLLPPENNPGVTCPNRVIERSFNGQERIMCCQKTKKPISIGKGFLTIKIYRAALELAAKFSGSSKICSECMFRAILGLYEPQIVL
jgi:hypothetical protein